MKDLVNIKTTSIILMSIFIAVIKEKNTRESGLILGMSLGFVGLLLVILAVVIVIIKYRKNRRLRLVLNYNIIIIV